MTAVLAFAVLSFSEAPSARGDFIWAKRLGGASNDIGYAITVDGAGSVYTTGRFVGTADFDPGAGTFNLTSAGDADIFVSKFDSNGDFVWAKQVGGANDDYGFGIALDDTGNVYTTGAFWGTVDFDPGAGTFNLAGAGTEDIFVSKLDSNGDFVWAKRVGGTINDIGQSIAIDGAGNVYTTGFFQGTVDFDPGPGTFNLTTAVNRDIFVLKLDSNGDFVWAKRLGRGGPKEGFGIALDAAGNVYTTGFFFGTVDFDPGPGTFSLTSAGAADIFISKLDSKGNFVWAKQLGGTSSDYGFATGVDGAGNVYTTGYFWGIGDFNPGPGTFNLTSAGTEDIFISKLDSNGNFVWAKQLGGTSNDIGRSITIDGAGNVYATGYFRGNADFDPGTGMLNLTSAGNQDIFVLKLDSNGDFVWAKQLGGTSVDIGYATAVDDTGNVYTTGLFSSTADFDPGPKTSDLTSAGGTFDVFVSKLGLLREPAPVNAPLHRWALVLMSLGLASFAALGYRRRRAQM